MAIAFIIYRVSDLKIVSYFNHDAKDRAIKLADGMTKESKEHEYKVGDEKWVRQNLSKLIR
jgi:hypothetical protein